MSGLVRRIRRVADLSNLVDALRREHAQAGFLFHELPQWEVVDT